MAAVACLLGSPPRAGDIVDPLPDIAPGRLVVRLVPIATSLISPLGLAAPDDETGRLFIYDQVGVVHVYLDDAPLAEPLLDVSSRLVAPLEPSYDERGLIGLAAHPDFAAHPLVYTTTSEPIDGAADFTTPVALPEGSSIDHQLVVAEWGIDQAQPNRVDPSTRREILRIDEPEVNHNGGALRFGPDGYLYLALGDGGGADDQDGQSFPFGINPMVVGHGPIGNGQNKDSVYGAILRIDVDRFDGNSLAANGAYAIPADNPFVGADGLDEIFAYGFRNPFSMSFDRATGELYVGDVGQNDIEEIDRVVAGGNYGWRLKEGSFAFDPAGTLHTVARSDGHIVAVPPAPLPPDLIDPWAEYDHDDGLAVIGGFVYRGTAFPALAGRYVFGDYSHFLSPPAGRLFHADASGSIEEFANQTGEPIVLGFAVKGFGEDADGELYLFGSSESGPKGTTGAVYRLVDPVGTSALRLR